MPARQIFLSACFGTVVALLVAVIAWAQDVPAPSDLFPTAPGPDSPEAQSFLRLVSEAARRHPDFGESLARIGESRGTLREVRSVRYPQIEAGFDTIGSLTNRTSIGGEEQRIPSQSVLRPDAVISVSQLIFDAGSSYHRISAAKAHTGAAKAEAEVALNDVALRALATYFDVWRYRVALQIADMNLQEHQRLTDHVIERAEMRAGSQSDVLRAMSRSNEAQAQLILAASQLRQADAAFTEIFGQLEETPPPPLPVPNKMFTEARAIDQALARNASMESTRKLVEAARQELNAERSAAYPSITLELNGRQFNVTSFDQRLYDVGARLVLRHKLFSGGAERGRRERAAARLRQAQYREESQRLTTERLVKSSLADISARQQRMQAFGLTVAANLSAQGAYEDQFALGRTSFMDMLDVQRELFNSQLQWLNAIVDLHLARYSMAAVTGDLLPFLGLEDRLVE